MTVWKPRWALSVISIIAWGVACTRAGLFHCTNKLYTTRGAKLVPAGMATCDRILEQNHVLPLCRHPAQMPTYLDDFLFIFYFFQFVWKVILTWFDLIWLFELYNSDGSKVPRRRRRYWLSGMSRYECCYCLHCRITIANFVGKENHIIVCIEQLLESVGYHFSSVRLFSAGTVPAATCLWG